MDRSSWRRLEFLGRFGTVGNEMESKGGMIDGAFICTGSWSGKKDF